MHEKTKTSKKAPKLTSVDFANCGNTDGRPDVDVSGHGCQSGVVPILIIGSQFLGDVCLYNVYPFGQLDLARPVKINKF